MWCGGYGVYGEAQNDEVSDISGGGLWGEREERREREEGRERERKKGKNKEIVQRKANSLKSVI